MLFWSMSGIDIGSATEAHHEGLGGFGGGLRGLGDLISDSGGDSV